MSFKFENLTQNLFLMSDGLRKAQKGAMGAILSHFSIEENSPAIVVMPTGSGKTAVITATPILLKSKSVLIISSSKLVRSQLTDEFKKFVTLKTACAIVTEEYPEVYECKTLLDDDEIDRFNKSDVVIGIPSKLINLFENEFDDYDADLFDLIIVDEAHHIPAPTWTKVVDLFPNAKKVFFTATPFRRDKKPLAGKIVYNYPLKLAYEEKIFGKVNFIPVDGDDDNIDKLIAMKAEEIFLADKNNGYNHVLLVRTDSKNNAKILEEIYLKNTKLKLKVVDSTKTYTTIKQTIKEMRDGNVDGVIAVNMMGEGFDFPHLKIAAIHKPHKSEAVTLQFIGRFARTNAKDIGDAKFIARPQEIRGKLDDLYKEGSIWNEIIQDISTGIIDQEVKDRKAIQSFEAKEDVEGEDVSLFSLAPYCHVKIYKVPDADLDIELNFEGQKIIRRLFSEELNCCVYITVNLDKPKWSQNKQIQNKKYNLYITYFNIEKKLLFINSTDKSEEFYEFIFKKTTGIVSGHFSYQLPKFLINKVLLDLVDIAFFNIGMQKKIPNSGESYRTMTGPNAQGAIKKIDGMLFSNGHMFCKATKAGSTITIGYSSASKVWANTYKNVSQFIEWCNDIANKVTSSRQVVTNSGYDHLPISVPVDTIPEDIYMAFWGAETYMNPPIVSCNGTRLILNDFDINILSQDKSKIEFKLVSLEPTPLDIDLKFNLKNGFEYNGKQTASIGDGQLTTYLNDFPIMFQTKDFGILIGQEFSNGTIDENSLFGKEHMLVVDWNTKKINIQKEFGAPDALHEMLLDEMVKSSVDYVIYDHSSGEMADIITIKKAAKNVLITFYHMKASTGPTAGNRVNEVYEVAGQIMKSVIYVNHREALRRKLRNRVSSRLHKIKKGTYDEIDDLLSGNLPIEIQMVMVQPGLTKSKAENKILSLLHACDNFISVMGNFKTLEVWCSA